MYMQVTCTGSTVQVGEEAFMPRLEWSLQGRYPPYQKLIQAAKTKPKMYTVVEHLHSSSQQQQEQVGESPGKVKVAEADMRMRATDTCARLPPQVRPLSQV